MDCELFLINGIKEIFLLPQFFMPLARIFDKNIGKNCKQDFTNKQWQEFLQGWNLVVFVHSKDKFEVQWSTFVETLNFNFSKAIMYIKNT